MVRRTLLYYRADQGLAAAPVGRRMAALLDDAATSVGRYAEEVALSRRWRA
jgi:hypothetical protein